MQRILDDFQRYVNYTNQAEEEKKAGYGRDYYTREVKNYAKSITDRIKQINNFSYAW
jgi:threonine aldolase